MIHDSEDTGFSIASIFFILQEKRRRMCQIYSAMRVKFYLKWDVITSALSTTTYSSTNLWGPGVGFDFWKETQKKTVKYTPTWHINLIIYGLLTHLCAFTTHLHTLKWNKGTIKEDHSSANKNVSEWIQVLHSKYIYTEVLTSSAWPLLFGEI